MKQNFVLTSISILSFVSIHAQDWKDIPIPADPGIDKIWELQENVSDDFNYNFDASSEKSNFGDNKWYNFYHNSWDGPGTTYWKYNHVWVDGSDVNIRASRWNKTNEAAPVSPWPNKMNKPNDGINAACITSNNTVVFPVFVEASVSVANISLATDIWLLSPDDTQEIDIMECYGGADSNNAFFAKDIHLSHHSFIRQPLQDYQPRGKNTWYTRSDITTSWGDYCWNDGERKYVQIGVNWIGPKHFEYYVDGDLVRVLYDKASATKKGSTWYYTYPSMTNGKLDFDANGYQTENEYATETSYNFKTLEAASNTSIVSIIDPYNYQNGNGFTKPLDIIINVESQNWHVDAGRTPNDDLLNDPSKNTMKVDWLRVYKPSNKLNIETPNSGSSIKIYPNPADKELHIKSEHKLDSIKIYNALGVLVYQQSKPVEIIPLNHLNTGVYFTSITSNKSTIIKRIIVQH
ncbi:beta-agarase D (GH16) [Formosa agariphila KMM 3901]|uniref:Beta-agarase D (GH16) n=1 Tax=Formosa agariphila (strain DSM 15362 / KCTC 12365 / LMG 23005 / KMM 3901 / M-2Alg 35-1) TaxID=1347342 RepID=T2KMC1_FORAG|nr:T9SS type A sorting domain-containing protein [Formosa agariphila]CDF79860.1 beta-agarase D (GH16) [Formosa agariphila KMM 3901]